MIQVDRLSKQYGSYKAVESIRFDIGRGEIVGLLGPNGAGKTTTMRMLTTYLSPTSGRASLAGHDVLDEPLEVRRKVGYLPENVPLYTEMRVIEYLRYRARLKDVSRSERRRAIGEVISRCQLGEVEQRGGVEGGPGVRDRVQLLLGGLDHPRVVRADRSIPCRGAGSENWPGQRHPAHLGGGHHQVHHRFATGGTALADYDYR